LGVIFIQRQERPSLSYCQLEDSAKIVNQAVAGAKGPLRSLLWRCGLHRARGIRQPHAKVGYMGAIFLYVTIKILFAIRGEPYMTSVIFMKVLVLIVL